MSAYFGFAMCCLALRFVVEVVWPALGMLCDRAFYERNPRGSFIVVMAITNAIMFAGAFFDGLVDVEGFLGILAGIFVVVGTLLLADVANSTFRPFRPKAAKAASA